jgi:hypothetical protein
MRTLVAASAILLLFVGAASAADVAHSNVIKPDTLTWKDNPAFPKGVKIAVLVGDPSKTGDTVVMRIKFPANFQMPPHTHPYSEVVTVISGHIGTNSGEKVDRTVLAWISQTRTGQGGEPGHQRAF